MTTNFDFASEFYKKEKELNIDWDIKGLVTEDLRVFAIGDDSKLLGRVFEILAAPIIKEIATEHNLIFKTPEKQNTYPDITLMSSEESNKKIAIDIKTTYSKEGRNLGFTLGSFTSYLRDNTKNIDYPYDQYAQHIILGFVYTRNLEAEDGHITDVENINTLDNPYLDVDFFIRNKIDITGERKGSGNTDNMGSISGRSALEFKKLNGPFTVLPEELYLHYWRNYPRNTNSKKHYIDLTSYFTWLDENKDTITDADPKELLSHKYKYEEWFKTNK